MNKKILTIIVTALAVTMVLTPLIGMVHAGKGQEKLFFEIYIDQHNEPFGARDFRLAPKWETHPKLGGDPNVVFSTIEYWADDLSVTVGPTTYNYPQVDVTGVAYLIVHQNVPDPDPVTQPKNVFDEFTLDFSEVFGADATIEVRRVAMACSNGEEHATFVGHGTGYLDGVKVSGTQTALVPPLERTYTGTVMGWPTP